MHRMGCARAAPSSLTRPPALSCSQPPSPPLRECRAVPGPSALISWLLNLQMGRARAPFARITRARARFGVDPGRHLAGRPAPGGLGWGSHGPASLNFDELSPRRPAQLGSLCAGPSSATVSGSAAHFGPCRARCLISDVPLPRTQAQGGGCPRVRQEVDRCWPAGAHDRGPRVRRDARGHLR